MEYIDVIKLFAVTLEQVLWWAISWLNANVEERREEREEKQAVSLQPAHTQ